MNNVTRYILKQFKLALEHIKENKKFFIYFLYLFLISIITGFLLPDFLQNLISSSAIEFIEGLTQKNQTGILNLFGIIFLNNLKVNFTMIILGVLLGIFSITITFVNGVTLGSIASVILKSQNYNPCITSVLLAGILPHGIIEIPTFILSASIGFRIGHTWIRQSNKGTRTREIFTELVKGIHTYTSIIIILVALAAFIETFITPFVMTLIGHSCGFDITSFSLLG